MSYIREALTQNLGARLETSNHSDVLNVAASVADEVVMAGASRITPRGAALNR